MSRARRRVVPDSEKLAWPPFLHPLDQAGWWLPEGLEPYQWQMDVIEAAAKPRSRVIVSTCNESGKTSLLIPWFGLSCMVAFPGCHVYSTSGSELQVREQLFENQLRPIVERLPGWDISINKMTVTAPEIHGISSRWVGYKCRSGGTAEGFHGKWEKFKDGKTRWRPCVYLVDESKSVPEDIFQAIIRINPCFLMALSTPGDESGWFYRGIDPDTIGADGNAFELNEDEEGDAADWSNEQIARRIEMLERRVEELQ